MSVKEESHVPILWYQTPQAFLQPLHPCLEKALEVWTRKVCGCAGTREATTPLTEVLPRPEVCHSRFWRSFWSWTEWCVCVLVFDSSSLFSTQGSWSFLRLESRQLVWAQEKHSPSLLKILGKDTVFAAPWIKASKMVSVVWKQHDGPASKEIHTCRFNAGTAAQPRREGVMGCVCHPAQEHEGGTGLGQVGSRGKGQSDSKFGTAEWKQGGQRSQWGLRRDLTASLTPFPPSWGCPSSALQPLHVLCAPRAGRMRTTRLRDGGDISALPASQWAASLQLPLAWQEEEEHRAASKGMGFSGSRIQFLSPLPKAEQMKPLPTLPMCSCMLCVQYKDHKHSLTFLSSLHEKIPNTWSKPIMLAMEYREVAAFLHCIYTFIVQVSFVIKMALKKLNI